MKRFPIALMALAGLASHAVAGAPAPQTTCGPEAGSLLVYPEYDNTRGTVTLLTVTNTNPDVLNGSVDVEFIYIDGETCLELNRSHRLTANDTLTVIAKAHNPNSTKGYAYAFAKSRTTGRAIKWDHLAGTLLQFNAGAYDYETNAIVFKAGEALAEGDATDLDSDGVRDFDGLEYAQAPDELLVPRFFGNRQFNAPKESGSGGAVNTYLILIGLTGARFTTVIDFVVYNDNEEAFSAQYKFECWDRVRLPQISGVFLKEFLLSTNHNPNEIQGPGASMMGGSDEPSPAPEAGWYRMNGNLAFSSVDSIADPAFLALQVEYVHQTPFGAASLPFTKGAQDNGGLLSHLLFAND